MKPIGAIAVALSMACAPAFAQQVYKWVDERGVVNYSTEAPKNREAKKLDPDASRVTIIPAMAPPTIPTIPGGTRSDPAIDDRVTRLEAQAERERAAQASLARADAERLAALRERCERERWVDCADDRALYARYGGTFGGPVPGYGYNYGSGVVVAPPIVRPIRPVPPTVILPAPKPPEPPPQFVKPRGTPRDGGVTNFPR